MSSKLSSEQKALLFGGEHLDYLVELDDFALATVCGGQTGDYGGSVPAPAAPSCVNTETVYVCEDTPYC